MIANVIANVIDRAHGPRSAHIAPNSSAFAQALPAGPHAVPRPTTLASPATDSGRMPRPAVAHS